MISLERSRNVWKCIVYSSIVIVECSLDGQAGSGRKRNILYSVVVVFRCILLYSDENAIKGERVGNNPQSFSASTFATI